MKKIFIRVFIMVLFSTFCKGQQLKQKDTVTRRNSCYLEVFGQGLGGSINYDQLFKTKKKIKTSLTMGLIYIPRIAEFGDGTYVGAPFSYNFLFGKRSHHFEVGLGLTLMLVTSMDRPLNSRPDIFYSYLSPKIGYRFQRPQGGIFFRLTANPMFALINHYTSNNFWGVSTEVFKNVAGFGYRIFPWPGLSIGYTFN